MTFNDLNLLKNIQQSLEEEGYETPTPIQQQAIPIILEGKGVTGTTINASTALQEAGTNLTSKYLKLDGTNTMTGTLNGTTINASTNLQEATVNLSSKYLKLDGTNTMTGALTLEEKDQTLGPIR